MPHPKRIFLVEDDPLIREWIVNWLNEHTPGTVVGWAANEPEATAWLAQHQCEWDVAVIDLWLSTGNGITVVQQLDWAQDQQVVVLSANVTDAMRRFCLRAGANAVFDRSCEFAKFTELLTAD